MSELLAPRQPDLVGVRGVQCWASNPEFFVCQCWTLGLELFVFQGYLVLGFNP